MRRLSARALCGAALAALLLSAGTACTNTGGNAASISMNQLTGVWTSASGARVSLTADHHASATGLQHAVHENACGSSFSDGRWWFFVSVKDGDMQSETATHGKSFALGTTADGGCPIFGDVRRDGHYDLCLKMDADTGCTDDELLRKRPS